MLCASSALAGGFNAGDLITIAAPAVSPPIDHYLVLRVAVPSGAIDTLANLPTGNVPKALTVSPIDGKIYVLCNNSLVRVNPCDGTVSTVVSGTNFPAAPNAGIVAHSNGSIYMTRSVNIIRVDPGAGTQTPFASVSALGVGANNLREGRDHQLYVATNGGSGLLPWVVKVDPTTAATQVYAKGNLQTTNVRDVTMDTRDSVYVLRVGFELILHRTDPVAQTVSPLITFSDGGSAAGWIVGHPDGGIYHPHSSAAGQMGILRIDPVTATWTQFVPQQNKLSFGGLDVARVSAPCIVPAARRTWGQVKALYR
jgi:hypothetical protein